MSAPSMATPFHDLARKRDLWWQFTIRTVELRHRGSYLGIVWAVLTPLLMLGLYYVVFGQIFGGSFGVLPDETRTDYALAFFLGLILHQVTSETLSLAPGIILANPNLVKKVVFPLDLLPLAQLGASWFNLLISITLMVLGAVALGRGVTIAGLVWLPVILLPLLLLTAGLGWLFAALGVFFFATSAKSCPSSAKSCFTRAPWFIRSRKSQPRFGRFSNGTPCCTRSNWPAMRWCGIPRST